MKKLILLFTITCFLTSCNVTESIVFDSNMSGNYVTAFDMAPMMQYANENRPPSQEGPKKEKIDTTIVFDDLYKTHKDSIAALTDEQRAEFDKLKGMTLKMQMDEEKSIFKFEMSKNFKAFDELKTIYGFQPATLKDGDDMDEEDVEAEDDPFKKQIEMQFEEVFSNSFYTLTYKFPKKVKSVSSKDAVISEDGKTVTYKVPWSAINGDASIMNLDVVLED